MRIAFGLTTKHAHCEYRKQCVHVPTDLPKTSETTAQGYYGPAYNLSSVVDCQPCEPRRSCPAATVGRALQQNCEAGYFCPGYSGANVPANRVALSSAAQPCTAFAGKSSTVYNGICGCPPGTFSSNVSLAIPGECTVCPDKFYCVGAQSSLSGVCGVGHFCPNGTSSPTEFPCSAGALHHN